MPNKAFLHKKSLIDKFRDDHKKGTGYIQAARAHRTWNNPMTRRKRTNKLNDWITSFAGKRHIRKLSRFNALKESNMQISDKMLDDVLAYYKTSYNWSDELIDREREDTLEWLQSYSDVFVPAYENGGIEDGLMAIADAEEMDVGRAELSMMEASKDVGDYTDDVMEIVFDDYGADPEKVIKHEDEITRIISNCHDKNSFIRACAMQIMDYLKSKSESCNESAPTVHIGSCWLKSKGISIVNRLNKLVSGLNGAVEYVADADGGCKIYFRGTEEALYRASRKEGWDDIVAEMDSIKDYKPKYDLDKVEDTASAVRKELVAKGDDNYLSIDNLLRNGDYQDLHDWLVNRGYMDKSEAKDTEEKLGYEKGHKNSRGEDAPWVIRSHKDNRVLASFASEEDAKEHLKRMKQFSKEESMETPNITNAELKKIVNAFLVSENDSAPMVEDVAIMEVTPVEDGQLIKFNYDGETTYCLVFGDPSKRRDTDLVYFMYDWQSGVDVNKENISNVDWILANEYVDIAGILEESNKSEAVKLTYVDTIRVPQWMWVADQTGDTSDLEDDEIEMLKEFQQEYKDKHLDDKGEDPYFSSHNDFDSLGGNVYDVDVYEMDNHQ